MFVLMKKKMFLITIITLIGLLASAALYRFTENPVLFSIAITFGTAFYHLTMRLAVGYTVNAIFHNKMDYTKKWFREKRFERGLYKKLRVRKWRKWIPTFDPEIFSLNNHSVEEIVQVTCQAEIVHEIIMAFSFVPVVFSIWFGSLGVFLVTSCASFLFDSIFVIMQRYNRPRMMRILRKKNDKTRSEPTGS